MTDPSPSDLHPHAVDHEAERGELLPGATIDQAAPDEDEVGTEFVSEPAKVMRVGSMIKQLLEEVRQTELDEPSRERLKGIYDTSITELGSKACSTGSRPRCSPSSWPPVSSSKGCGVRSDRVLPPVPVAPVRYPTPAVPTVPAPISDEGVAIGRSRA